jgi:hypothetical protein
VCWCRSVLGLGPTHGHRQSPCVRAGQLARQASIERSLGSAEVAGPLWLRSNGLVAQPCPRLRSCLQPVWSQLPGYSLLATP